MIFDSSRWRRELRATAATLQRRATQQRWTEASLLVLERELMLAFYTVRKLIEGHLTRTELGAQCFSFKTFPSLGKRVSYVIWPDVSEKYDLTKPSNYSRNAEFISHQFIHSFVFRPTRAKALGLTGVFVASDREKDQRVFWFSVPVLRQVLGAVAGSRSPGFRVAPDRNEMFFP